MTTKTDTRRIDNVQIRAAERRTNSANGNPRWKLHTSEGTFTTADDASLGYAIENYTDRHRPDTFVIGDGAPAVTLIVSSTSARVCYLEKDGELMH